MFPILFVGCNSETKTIDNTEADAVEMINANYDPDCVEFVALWPAGDIAKQIGRDKKWVFLNHTIDVWDIPPFEGVGSVVSKLRASSYARIIEKTENDYKVETPKSLIQGWISNKHVKTISKKNPKTKALCN